MVLRLKIMLKKTPFQKKSDTDLERNHLKTHLNLTSSASKETPKKDSQRALETIISKIFCR